MFLLDHYWEHQQKLDICPVIVVHSQVYHPASQSPSLAQSAHVKVTQRHEGYGVTEGNNLLSLNI